MFIGRIFMLARVLVNGADAVLNACHTFGIIVMPIAARRVDRARCVSFQRAVLVQCSVRFCRRGALFRRVVAGKSGGCMVACARKGR